MDQLERTLHGLVLTAFSLNGAETELTDLGIGVHISIRASERLFPVMFLNEPRLVKTIEVTRLFSTASLDKRRWILGKCDTTGIPRGLGAPIYTALEKICNNYGRALRGYCVVSIKLREHLVKKHGFVIEGHGSCPLDNSVIKVVDRTIFH